MLQQESHTRVTLALDIVRRIGSGPLAGYHELSIVKHQIDLCDVISVEPAANIEVRCDNPAVPCDAGNICWKAAELLRERFGIRDGARISIRKRIPVMGGLAGGSANAATALGLLAGLWGIGLPSKDREELGRKLGMDVPYFFAGGTAFDTEATGILRPIETGVSLDLVLVIPEFGVSTREAYGAVDYARVGSRRRHTESMIGALISGNREAVLEAVHNDFEISVFRRFPVLAAIKSALLSEGAEAAFMSGSGSTVAGIARDAGHAEELADALRGHDAVRQVIRTHSWRAASRR